MRGISVLQSGGDPSSIRDHSTSFRRSAGSAACVQEQLPAARSNTKPQLWEQPDLAPQCSHRRRSGFQQTYGYAVRAFHDLLATANGMLSLNIICIYEL